MPRKTKPKTESTPTKEKVPRRVTRAQRAFLISTSSVLLLLAIAATYSFVYANQLPPRTSIGGVAVGGLTHSEAQAKLRQRAEQFAAQNFELQFGDKKWQVTPATLESSVAFDEALDALWKHDKGGRWQDQGKQLFLSLVKRRNVAVPFTAMSAKGQSWIQENVFSQIEVPYRETTLNFEPGNVTVVPGVAGQRVDNDQFKDQLYTALVKRGAGPFTLELREFKPETTAEQAAEAQQRATALLSAGWKVPYGSTEISVDPKAVAGWLATEVKRSGSGTALALQLTVKDEEAKKAIQDWSNQITQAPVNALIQQDGAGVKVTDNGKDGRTVDQNATLAALRRLVTDQPIPASRALPVSIVTTKPEVRSETLAALGIKELIGTATTDYAGSPNNRKFNIAKGQSSLNRLLLKNGEVFSTTTALGPVEESTGYLPELVIKGNRTIPEAGGGLCQVSTTLFRSVLNAGLPIVARQNHAYRVSYYERGVGPGLDATVYIPNPDLKWENNTGHAIYIQSFVKDNKITFNLFGTGDGREVTISAPTILEEYPVGAPIYVETDTLYKDETKQIETPHAGAKTSVSYTVRRNGQEIYNKTFISVYRAWPAQYLVGTKERPAGETPPAQ